MGRTRKLHLESRLRAVREYLQGTDSAEKIAKRYGISTYQLQYLGRVATTGTMKVLPGSSNVIPAEVQYSIDLRDVSMENRARAEQQIREAAARLEEEMNVTIEFGDMVRTPSVLCSPEIMDVIEQTTAALSLSSIRMPSGACHDAMHFGPLCPIGMIFVPSINGYSHRGDEYTPIEDCVNGANVLLNTLLKLDQTI